MNRALRKAATPGLALLAVATLVLCVSLSIGLGFPGSGPARAIASVLPLAEPHALAAQAAFKRGDWRRAEAESRAELAVSPVRQDAWLRLARIDFAEQGRLGPTGALMLSRSYDAVPYDLTARGERRCFVRVHSAELPADLRAAVEAETAVLADAKIKPCPPQ